MDKTPSFHSSEHRFNPWSGKIPHASGQLSQSTTRTEPTRSTWAGSSPCSPQLEKAWAQQWRPSTAKKFKNNNLKNCDMSSNPTPTGEPGSVAVSLLPALIYGVQLPWALHQQIPLGLGNGAVPGPFCRTDSQDGVSPLLQTCLSGSWLPSFMVCWGSSGISTTPPFFSSCLPGSIWASSFSWGNAKVLNHRKILTNGEVVHRQSHIISLYPALWTHSIHTLLALAGTCKTDCAAPPASNPLGRLHCNLALGDGVGSCWLDLLV